MLLAVENKTELEVMLAKMNAALNQIEVGQTDEGYKKLRLLTKDLSELIKKSSEV